MSTTTETHTSTASESPARNIEKAAKKAEISQATTAVRRLQHSNTAASPNTAPSGISGSGHSAAPYHVTARPVFTHTGIGARLRHTRGALWSASTSTPSTVRFGSLACAPTKAAPVTTNTKVPRAITTSAVIHSG